MQMFDRAGRLGCAGAAVLMVAALYACDSSPDTAPPAEDPIADGGVDVGVDGAVGGADSAVDPMDATPEADAAVDDPDLGGEDAAVDDPDIGGEPDLGVDATPDEPATCEDGCERVADCLIDQCDGFAGGARAQLERRCLELCGPQQAELFVNASCDALIETLSAQLAAVEDACQPDPEEPVDPPVDGEGLNALYIGHSFGRPFAEQVTDWTRAAGVEGHRQQIVMRGGAGGAPLALWNNPQASAEIRAILDGGDIELLTMICCSTTFLEDGTDPGVRAWMDYALERNPDTEFAMAIPWVDFPEDYASVVEYAALWTMLRDRWHALIDQLRIDYPGVSIFTIPHGGAAIELRALFEAGELDDVEVMTSREVPAIFTDRKGHANAIMLDLGTLVWVGAIYGVDLTDHPLVQDYAADLVGLAERIIEEDGYTR